MKVITLVENTSISDDLETVHGLSFYIETENHNILFDLGPDSTLIENAKRLGVDLAKVDIVVISHGHKDHGGALSLFMKYNETAKIYISRHAFSHVTAKVLGIQKYIGLESRLRDDERIVYVDESLQIDDELLIFSDVEGNFESLSNINMYANYSGRYQLDDFRHEQNLIVKSNGKTLLLTGCSHRGIKNIYNRAVEYAGEIDVCIGGFHLYNPLTRKTNPIGEVRDLGVELEELNTQFHTCHCTGNKAYHLMKEKMGKKLKYIATGQIIEI